MDETRIWVKRLVVLVVVVWLKVLVVEEGCAEPVGKQTRSLLLL